MQGNWKHRTPGQKHLEVKRTKDQPQEHARAQETREDIKYNSQEECHL